MLYFLNTRISKFLLSWFTKGKILSSICKPNRTFLQDIIFLQIFAKNLYQFAWKFELFSRKRKFFLCFVRKRSCSDYFREKFCENGNFAKHKISVFVIMAKGFTVSTLPSNMPGTRRRGRGGGHLHSIALLLLIFCFRQCCGFMTFLCGSGSADPCLWLMDPDRSISSLTFKSPTKNNFFKKVFLLITFWRYVYIIFQR
jgi:hypothetical protein